MRRRRGGKECCRGGVFSCWRTEGAEAEREEDMDDPFDRLSEQEITDACAFADGTLPEARRAEVERRVQASLELTALVVRQRSALTATARLASEPVPDSLRIAVDRLQPKARRPRLSWALSAAAVAAAVLVVFVVLSVSAGPGGPTVAAAADFALQAGDGSGSRRRCRHEQTGRGRGRRFVPDYAAAYGWQASGVRTGEVDGRPATVVFYQKDGQTVGYAIVDGAALARPGGAASTTRAGVEYLTLTQNGRRVVTWENRGHTCVLVGSAPASELVTLASWSGSR